MSFKRRYTRKHPSLELATGEPNPGSPVEPLGLEREAQHTQPASQSSLPWHVVPPRATRHAPTNLDRGRVLRRRTT